MAKIITQISFFDYTEEVEKLGDLERLKIALEGIDDEELMLLLEKERGNGRDDYPIRAMWNLKIAAKVFQHKKRSLFLRELARNAQMRRMCGLLDYEGKKLVPPSRVFTGFEKSLRKHADRVKAIFKKSVHYFYETVEGFGEETAGDGKYLDSYAKNKHKETREKTDNRTENDAEYAIKEYHYIGTDGKSHTKKETHYGFKAHIVCDVKTELPIAVKVTKANYDEKKAMKEILENMGVKEVEVMKHMRLDRGYDSLEMIKLLKSKEIMPLIDIRNMWRDNTQGTRQYKNTDMVYNAYGEVFHYDNVKGIDEVTGETRWEWLPVKMKYEGYDKQKKCLRYSHKGKIRKIYISYDERIFLPIARDSEKFKKLYKGRTAVERLNGRLDRDYMFEDHVIRGLEKMDLEVTIAMIVMNGMAVGKMKRNLKSIRSLVKVA